MRPRWKLSSTALADSAVRIRESLPATVHWIPDVNQDFTAECLAALKSARLACRNVVDALVLQRMLAASNLPESFQSPAWLLRYPVVAESERDMLAELAGMASVTLVIDHFRHAELASQAAQDSQRSIGILIDADCGHSRTGIRPGPDSVLLAQGVVNLPGLILQGIFLRTQVLPEGSARVSDLQNAVIVGRHCQKFINASGIGCDELIAEDSVSLDADMGRSLTGTVCSPTPVFAGLIQEPLDSGRSQLKARVVSRPSLEWCVVAAGTSDLKCIEVPDILHPAGAAVRTMDLEQMTLGLSGDALDLRIGDEVTIAVGMPVALAPDES